ncbi:MAG: hemolysin family protein [Chloroflexota bacterium]
MTDILYITIGIFLLLIFDSILVAARSGFLQTSYARLLAMREQAEPGVQRVVKLLPALSRLRASLSLTLVLTRFSLAGLFLLLLASLPVLLPGIVQAIALLVSAMLLFGVEWSVESAVSHNPELWVVRLATFVQVLMVVTSILLLPLSASRDMPGASDNSNVVTEDDVKTLLGAGEEEGIFAQDERRMIFSIFELGDTLAREIMVPRIDMLALDVNTPLADGVDALLKSGHSRVPVYEESADHTLGLLYAKDLLRVWREGGQLESLRSLLRPAYFVPEAKKVDELLTEMQSQRIHMAIVVDEYGGVAGLVTMEDIVEEIVGEIQDEYDQGEEAPYQELKDGDYLFLGRIDLDDFNETMGSDLPKEDADTLGGYIYSRLGRVPTVGETVRKDNLLLTVEQVSARRIRKVRASWHVLDAQDNTEGK